MNSQTKKFSVLRVLTGVIFGIVLMLIGFSIWFWVYIGLPEKERRAEALRWEQFEDEYYAERKMKNPSIDVE